MEIDKERLLEMLRERPRHERITLLRSLYNLSQLGLARIAKVQRGTVSTWEAEVPVGVGGRGHEPAKTARVRLGAYFNLPPYVFTDEWGEPNPHASQKAERKVSDVGITVPPPNIKRLD
jgi:transcriptional regulator with XRE-family HTH domain